MGDPVVGLETRRVGAWLSRLAEVPRGAAILSLPPAQGGAFVSGVVTAGAGAATGAFEVQATGDNAVAQRAGKDGGDEDGGNGCEQLLAFVPGLCAGKCHEKDEQRQAVGERSAEVEAGGAEVQFGGVAAAPGGSVCQGDGLAPGKAAKPRTSAAAVAFGAAFAFADVIHGDDLYGGGVGGENADADDVIGHKRRVWL